jgi:hypothetical protein
MPMTESPPTTGSGGNLPLLMAADLQDQLMVVTNDLERLQRLLDDASETLSGHFYGASANIQHALRDLATEPDHDGGSVHGAMQELAGAITALQFHDMATQLIAHTHRRLRNCADRIACEAMGQDDEGPPIIEEGPGRPNPVTQDEMDAGSIELF